MTNARFCARLGIPRSTWYYWRTCHLQGRVANRWPAPVIDVIEEVAANKALAYSQWGLRKIWGLLRRDGIKVSAASVKRALARRDLLLPVRYQTERRNLAKSRRALFTNPPCRRNRVWQTDFSEVETIKGGTWQISPVVDYIGKVCLACPVSGTQAAKDAIAAVRAAIAEAEEIMGHRLLEDCTDPITGEIYPVTIVSDNGPAYKSDASARLIASHPELAHVRTRHHSPQTNGVVERFNESIKYEHIYTLEISDVIALADEAEAYREGEFK